MKSNSCFTCSNARSAQPFPSNKRSRIGSPSPARYGNLPANASCKSKKWTRAAFSYLSAYVTSPLDVDFAIWEMFVGDTMTLDILRNGSERTIRFEIMELGRR